MIFGGVFSELREARRVPRTSVCAGHDQRLIAESRKQLAQRLDKEFLPGLNTLLNDTMASLAL